MPKRTRGGTGYWKSEGERIVESRPTVRRAVLHCWKTQPVIQKDMWELIVSIFSQLCTQWCHLVATQVRLVMLCQEMSKYYKPEPFLCLALSSILLDINSLRQPLNVEAKKAHTQVSPSRSQTQPESQKHRSLFTCSVQTIWEKRQQVMEGEECSQHSTAAYQAWFSGVYEQLCGQWFNLLKEIDKVSFVTISLN